MNRFCRPTTLEAAYAEMASGELRPIAGATDLYPSSVSAALGGSFLDVTAIEGLGDIQPRGSTWSIGGATTWAAIERAPLPPLFRGLQSAAGQIGGPQIQQVATLAGNLCTASPAGDGIPILLTLGATVTLASHRGVRVLPVADFIVGYRQSDISADELVISIDVPDQPEARSSFQKLGSRSHLVISIAMASVVLSLDERARLRDVAVAVGACSPVARRLEGLETLLNGLELGAAADVAKAYSYDELTPIDDVRGTAEYRKDVVPVLVARAIQDCEQEPAGT